ncbi:dynamin family protein [Acidovorax delafieldii]|nr:dynamin family protein [Acidovorax delafieldii]
MITSKTLDKQVARLMDRLSRFDEVLDQHPDLTRGLRGKIQESNWLNADALQSAIAEKAREGRQLRVGIIGRVKAGKSSLLNALLFDGKDVLPKAATPMTASLTVLAYGELPRAEVEPFEQKDLAEMARLAAEYERELKARLEARLAQQNARPPTFGGRPAPPMDPERLQQAVRRELDQDPLLGAAKDMHDRILQAGGMPVQWGHGETIQLEADSIEALRERLADYVGANGRFTPFTNCLRLYLPLPGLKDLEVVDTPGINDPIPSRETRTYRELHRCDAVFVVSPAGQFLNAQDLELMDRLGKKEGVREVFLVASQVDNQLFGSVQRKFGGQLPEALADVQQILTKQARQILAAQRGSNPGVAQLLSGLQDRLVVTSSVSHALLVQPKGEWDTNTRHIQQMLGKLYPAAFGTPEASREHLTSLAGIAKTRGLLEHVRERKESIQASSVQDFVQDRGQVLAQSLTNSLEILGHNRATAEAATGEGLEDQLKALQSAKTRGTSVVNLAVQNAADDSTAALEAALAAAADAVFGKARRAAEGARGTGVESYTVDSDGVGAWIARNLWGGGQETRTQTVQTIKAGTVRNALESLHLNLERAQQEAVTVQRTKLRQSLVRSVMGRLRETQVLADRDIDGIALEQACLTAIGELRSFDDPQLPALPDDLTRSGTLKGSAAECFDQAAQNYLLELQKAASLSGRNLALAYENRLKDVDVGAALFGHYEEQIQSLKSHIKERTATLKRYDALMADLKELQHGA